MIQQVRQWWRSVVGRVQCAWHVLRGRPLIYRVWFADGITVNSRYTHHLRVQDTTAVVGRFSQARAAYSFVDEPLPEQS